MAIKLFCNVNCRKSYKTDRENKLIYGMAMLKDVVPHIKVEHEVACKLLSKCLYCSAQLLKAPRIRIHSNKIVGLCPVCGKLVYITRQSTHANILIGSCGDGFHVDRWISRI